MNPVEQFNEIHHMKTMTRVIFLCGLLGLAGQHLHASQMPGYVLEWGWNTAEGTVLPVKLVASNVVSVSVGFSHNLALRGDSTVFGWGAITSVGSWAIKHQAMALQMEWSESTAIF